MDIQNYIASGILEQYVLGQLTPTERREVEQYAMEYPEIRRELDAIEGAMEQYAQLNAVEPPANLEASILERIRSQSSPAPAETNRPKTPLEKPIQNKGGARVMLYLAMAAAIAAVFWGWSQMKEAETRQVEIDGLQVQLDSLANDCDDRISRLQATEQAFAFIKDNNTTPVQMTGTDKAPGAVATVFWNETQKKSYLDVVNMPPVPSDKQYQLWAIVDGTPVDMGVFDVAVNENGFVEVPFIENPQAFAVTLEQRGGSPTPTLEEMYVIGNAG